MKSLAVEDRKLSGAGLYDVEAAVAIKISDRHLNTVGRLERRVDRGRRERTVAIAEEDRDTGFSRGDRVQFAVGVQVGERHRPQISVGDDLGRRGIKGAIAVAEQNANRSVGAVYVVSDTPVIDRLAKIRYDEIGLAILVQIANGNRATAI